MLLFSRYWHFERKKRLGLIVSLSRLIMPGSAEALEIDDQILEAFNRNRVFPFGRGIFCPK